MRLDFAEFPIVWMREDDGEDSPEATRREVIALVARRSPFVLMVDRVPQLSELATVSPEEKKMRSQLFKEFRAEFTRWCGGMIMIGNSGSLPAAFKKPIEGLSALMGVPVLFSATESEARQLAINKVERMTS